MPSKVRVLWAILTVPFLCSCVTSKEPLLGPDTRVLPWIIPKKFQTFERDSANAPWIKGQETTLVPDLNDLTIRYGKDVFSLHPIGFRRFLAQSLIENRYAYGIVEIRGDEGIVNFMTCETFDRTTISAAGVTVEGGVLPVECKLDKANNPLNVLLQLASRAKGGREQRYVPVK
jgi:hypothetical protein